jgi:hypothetical protein
VNAAALSDVGRVRKRNEDAVAVLPHDGLVIVAAWYVRFLSGNTEEVNAAAVNWDGRQGISGSTDDEDFAILLKNLQCRGCGWLRSEEYEESWRR